MNNFRTLWPYFQQHRLRLIGGLLSLIIVDLIQLLIPRVVKHAVDHLSDFKATSASLAAAGLSILAMALVIGLFRFIWRQMIIGFSRIVEKELRAKLFAKLLTMSPAWFLTRTTGGIMAYATNDLDAVRMASGMGLVALTDAVLLGTAAVGFMIWINPQLTLYALLPMILVPILTRYLGSLMLRRFHDVQEIFSKMSGDVREYLSGIRVVQAYARENLVIQDMDRVGQEYVAKNISLNRVSGTFFPLMLMFTNLSTAMVIYFGGRMAIIQSISPGDFVAFISYLGLITWPMMAMGWVTNLVQRGAASLGRINEILDTQPDIEESTQPARIDDIKGLVEFKHLNYIYPGHFTPIFNELNLVCQAGRITAVAGRTGSGKTTLLNLIPRLFDPPAETVFIDGIPVEKFPLAELRGSIGYVPQDGYIFSGTIAENIAFGRSEASEEQIRSAAINAEIHEEIMKFPRQYQTFVGERGVTLSGGQKQRLALARALLLDPKILILDDTLSAVDSSAEERILTRLSKNRAGQTTIVTSHRLTSLQVADMIYVIEDGRVIQSGSHEELVKTDGYYANLYCLQQAQEECVAPAF